MNIISIQDLINLKADIDNLAEIVNGGSDVVVNRRYGGVVNSISRSISLALNRFTVINITGAYQQNQVYVPNDVFESANGTLYLVIRGFTSTNETNDLDGANVVPYTTKSIELSAIEMSAVGDGVAIDTQSIIDDISTLAALGGGVLKGKPGKTYVLDALFEINHSNIIIDLNGASIKWVGTNVNASGDRTNAIFRFRGATVESETKSCTITIQTPAIHSNEIVVSGALSITLSKGDYLNFQAQASDYLTTANYSLLTIVDSVSYDSVNDETTITIHDNLPFEFNDSAKLSRCDVLKNVGVINAHLIDTKSTTRDNGICGVNFGLVDGVVMDKITMEGPYFPVATIYNYRNAVVTNGSAWDAKATEGGQGYYVQFGGGIHTYAANLHLVNGRHTVDLNQCYHALIERCTGLGNSSTDLQTHGSWEYDITFRKCTGSVNMAGSGAQFGSMAKKFTVEDCEGDALFSYAFAHDIHVSNSTFRIIQMRANDARFDNVTSTEYTRFFPNSHPAYDVKNRVLVNGGTIKSETYNNANFIYDGANVEFHGTEVYCQWTSSAIVKADNLKMFGGVFYGGFLNATHQGRWEFNNTTFDATTFVFTNNTFDGASLSLINPSVRNPLSTGLIRNQLADNSYTLRANADLDNTSTGHFNLQILGGNVYVSDPVNDKAIDLAQPRSSLNIDIRGLTVTSGAFICDLRYPEANIGEINIDLADAGVDSTISITPFSVRYQDGTTDIHTIFDSLPEKVRGTRDIETWLVATHAYVDQDYTANNYPRSEKPRGMLRAEYDRVRNIKTLTMTYSRDATAYDGYTYQQINTEGAWSSWRLLTAESTADLLQRIDSELTTKIQQVIDSQ